MPNILCLIQFCMGWNMEGWFCVIEIKTKFICQYRRVECIFVHDPLSHAPHVSSTWQKYCDSFLFSVFLLIFVVVLMCTFVGIFPFCRVHGSRIEIE